MILHSRQPAKSLLLVLAGGTAVCHTCFHTLACQWWFCLVGGLQHQYVKFVFAQGGVFVLVGHINLWGIKGRWEENPSQWEPVLASTVEGESDVCHTGR